MFGIECDQKRIGHWDFENGRREMNIWQNKMSSEKKHRNKIYNTHNVIWFDLTIHDIYQPLVYFECCLSCMAFVGSTDDELPYLVNHVHYQSNQHFFLLQKMVTHAHIIHSNSYGSTKSLPVFVIFNQLTKQKKMTF